MMGITTSWGRGKTLGSTLWWVTFLGISWTKVKLCIWVHYNDLTATSLEYG